MKKNLAFILCLILISGQHLFADALDDVRQYIHNRTNPDQVREIEHCGFQAQIELRENLHLLEPGLQALAKTLLVEPVRDTSIVSPLGHFTLHYDTSSWNAVSTVDVSGNGIPDYIDSAAIIMDHVWEVEIEQMGFSAPPDENGNPVENYPIYFTNFSYYGLTSFNTSEDISALSGNNYTSYIELHNDYEGGFYTKGLEGLKVTAAHEFNHAIQLGYNFRTDDIYFMEMTSTWLEDYVYDDINDYLQYLDSFIPRIDAKAFNTRDGNSEYANGIYLHMLEKEYGPEAIMHIWNKTRDENAMDAVDSYLESKNSSFALSQNNFAAWLYFTGTRTQGDLYFPEAALYPEAPVSNGVEAIETTLYGLRMRHIAIGVDRSLVYRAKVAGSENDGYFTHLNNEGMNLQAKKFGNNLLFNQSADKPLIVVLTNPTENQIKDITYSIDLSPATPSSNPLLVQQSGQTIVFHNVPPYGKISIFSINGRLVQHIRTELTEVSPVEWNLSDRHGRKVASGIYIYYVKGADTSSKGKFAVVRK